jgi:serine protease DegQ
MWRRTWLTFAQAVTVAVAALFVVATFKPGWLSPGLGGASVVASGAATARTAPAARKLEPSTQASNASAPANGGNGDPTNVPTNAPNSGPTIEGHRAEGGPGEAHGGSGNGSGLGVGAGAAGAPSLGLAGTVSPHRNANSFSLAARRAAPAVVSITASRLVREPQAEDPRFRFFMRERPNAPGASPGPGAPRTPSQAQAQAQTQWGLGSGVIVSPDGYLLTNRHVVADAVEIEVQLADGRATRAQLVGSDAETDIAVLKILLPNLPVLALADSSALQVGDSVLAIGNPFDIGQTVTAGIVSALERTQRGSSPFQHFIQTDAAINPGNSGGALVDTQGALVGINTAIFSRNGGGNMGIGFAVPVDTARQVMQAIISGGKVRRGFIGVDIQDLGAELARQLALPIQTGALVTGVLGRGPAARAGLQPGDVILAVGEKAVGNRNELFSAIAALPPASAARLAVQRGTQTLELTVTVAERPVAAALR